MIIIQYRRITIISKGKFSLNVVLNKNYQMHNIKFDVNL